MSIRVNLTPYFRDIVERKETLEANGHTVGEVIDDIDRDIRDLRKNVSIIRANQWISGIYVNQETAFPDELNRKVKDNDEVTILTVIGGG